MILQGCDSAIGKMTRTTAAPAPLQPRQTKHGHKRKGKPVEAWMLELERAQAEENGAQSLDLIAIDQIADGVEQMVFSWGRDKQERGQEYAKLSKSLAKENSHELRPWSLNKTEDVALESASAKEPVGTRGDGATHPPVIAVRPLKQRGNRRDRSVAADSENPQPLKGEDGAPQGKHETAKCLLSDPCHGVLTASNRMRVCPTQSKGGFEIRAREDSTCQAVIAEQESMGGSIEAGSVAKKGHILVLPKEGELWPCVGTVWTPEVPIPSPERRTHQEDVVNETGDGFAQILAGDVGGSVAPLLGQSPLCAQSPSPSGEIAQGSEVSNERDGLFTSLADPHEDRAEGFISLLPFLDASPCCGEETESVEVGTFMRSFCQFSLSAFKKSHIRWFF